MTRAAKSGLSRRTFFRTAGVRGAGSLLASRAPASSSSARQPAGLQGEAIDIAVVGAGIAGVYCAWRLKQENPNRKIVIYEASDRIGGRLLSVRPPDVPTMVAELGGMRILPTVHLRVANLVSALNSQLSADDQIEFYDFPVDEPQNIAYLRGTYLRLADFQADQDKVPCGLSFRERGLTPGGIILQGIEQIVPGITDPALDDAKRRQIVRGATFDGLPLYRQGFWNLLARVMSSEAYQLAADGGGYDSVIFNWNAADAIPWFLADFGFSPQFKGFKDGFQTVPDAIVARFRQAGGDVKLSTPLVGFDTVANGFDLDFGNAKVHADSLILAMPRRSQELLAPKSPPLQEISELISSVTGEPLFKIFATYESPWWRFAGFTSANGTYTPIIGGRTVTDLPVRQTYYWPHEDGSPATTGPAMLMASYHDGPNTGFWHGLEVASAFPRLADVLPEAFFTGNCDPATAGDWCKFQAPKRMVDELVRELAEVHDLAYTPHVVNAAFRDWGDDPYGGGWNAWNIGVRSWEVRDRIVQPFDGLPLHVCGEAYSDAQGWVEGALQTADLVLEKFGVAPL
jgi:monoamine oxidase